MCVPMHGKLQNRNLLRMVELFTCSLFLGWRRVFSYSFWSIHSKNAKLFERSGGFLD